MRRVRTTAGLDQLTPPNSWHWHGFKRRHDYIPAPEQPVLLRIRAMEGRSHQKQAKRVPSLPIITIPWATE
jgi:hypothetical protein